ncbi:MAG: hypothetical protein RMJ86_10275 [Anaerolineae bacterium]|nr:hypothetical protein [Anaerolineae bacterium]
MKKITRNVYYHTTTDGMNIGLVVGEDAVVCVDLPVNPDEALAWKTQIAELTDRPIRAVMFTSSDRLNSEAAEAFGVTIIGHTSAFAQPAPSSEVEVVTIVEPTPVVMTPLRLLPGVPQLTFDRAASVVVSREPLQLVDIVHYGGYALDASVVMPRGVGVAFAGGIATMNQPPVLTQADFARWLEVLDMLKSQTDFTTLVPGCGPVTTPIEAANFTRTYIETAIAQVRDLIRANQTRSDLTTLVPKLIEFCQTLGDESRATRRAAGAVLDPRVVRAGLERIYDDFKAGVLR